MRRGITQWAWNEDHLFNPGNRLFAQEQVHSQQHFVKQHIILCLPVHSPHICMTRQGWHCHCVQPDMINLGWVRALQDLFGRSQKAEKKAKICMHTGTFVYHFKGQSSRTHPLQPLSHVLTWLQSAVDAPLTWHSMLRRSTLELWPVLPAGSTLPIDPNKRANWHMPGSEPAPKQQRKAPKKKGKAKAKATPAAAEETQQQQDGQGAAVRRWAQQFGSSCSCARPRLLHGIIMSCP